MGGGRVRGSSGWHRLAPLEPAAAATYLAAYGLVRFPPAVPRLELGVVGHAEQRGHTWYTIDCALELPGGPARCLRWRCSRRLAQMREDLHSYVRGEVGGAYGLHFGDTPFARKGGLPGTTARLGKWCNALAAFVSSGSATPGVMAHVLRFLDAPNPDGQGAATAPGCSTQPAQVLAKLDPEHVPQLSDPGATGPRGPGSWASSPAQIDSGAEDGSTTAEEEGADGLPEGAHAAAEGNGVSSSGASFRHADGSGASSSQDDGSKCASSHDSRDDTVHENPACSNSQGR